MTNQAVKTSCSRLCRVRGRWLWLLFFLVFRALPVAAASPWENAVDVLRDAFTGPIARGLSLVAIVVGGITMSFDEGGGSKRMLAGILFGVGMAIGAVNFMAWLFP